MKVSFHSKRPNHLEQELKANCQPGAQIRRATEQWHSRIVTSLQCIWNLAKGSIHLYNLSEWGFFSCANKQVLLLCGWLEQSLILYTPGEFSISPSLRSCRSDKGYHLLHRRFVIQIRLQQWIPQSYWQQNCHEEKKCFAEESVITLQGSYVAGHFSNILVNKQIKECIK